MTKLHLLGMLEDVVFGVSVLHLCVVQAEKSFDAVQVLHSYMAVEEPAVVVLYRL